LSKKKNTRDKLSLERKFYLDLFSFYCDGKFEEKDIVAHLSEENKELMLEIIQFTNQLRKEIIIGLIQLQKVHLYDLGSFSSKRRDVKTKKGTTSIQKVSFRPSRKILRQCKKK